MKSWLKKAGAIALASFLALFLYANLRRPTPAEQVPPVHLKIFSLNRALTASEHPLFEAALRQQAGVTAVSIAEDGTTFSVTYQPEQCSPETLCAAASLGGMLQVAEKNFPTGPTCPIPPFYRVKQQLLKYLSIF